MSSGVNPGGGTTAAKGVSSGRDSSASAGAPNGGRSGSTSSFGVLSTSSGGSSALTAICGASSTLLPQRARIVVLPSVITCSPANNRTGLRVKKTLSLTRYETYARRGWRKVAMRALRGSNPA